VTTIFPPGPGPRVFALPPGADFTGALVAGLESRLEGQPPEAWARIDIWVNTRRAARGLTERLSTGPARLLPRIRVVTELAAEPALPADLPPPVPALRRKLELARLVQGLIDARPGLAAETAAFDLADSLADLMDEMRGEAVDPAALATLDIGEHAAHWQTSLAFLSIVRDWLDAGNMVEGQARLRAAAEALAADWAISPPAHPVIVAGSTGSRGATRAFMAAVARLPQGAVILPGLDADLPPPVWERLAEDDRAAGDHPQHGLAAVCAALGIAPWAVPSWHATPAPNPARAALVSLALRPAPVTDQWMVDGPVLAPSLPAAAEGLTWIEAESPRAEAEALALILRAAAEEGQRAALITPDRMLTRQVTAALARWGLRPDDSAGRPLALTPPGVLLARLADLACARLTPEVLLALLKHPLTASAPDARRPHLRQTEVLELRFLRGGPPFLDWDALEDWAARTEAADPAWMAWLRRGLAPLAPSDALPLPDLVARHRAAAETLAAGPHGGPHQLWDKDAGRAALTLLDELAAEADAGGTLGPAQYRALLASLMAGREVPEEAVITHPGIAIWGTLEARVQSADLVLLGGLNEGTWPRLPGPDPWLSRGMRRALGLPSPERVIGLSAHDFQSAAGAARVVLSRATRDAEAPTVPSRWLLRLQNLMEGLAPEGPAALEAAKDRGKVWLARAALVDRPAAPVPAVRRPSPRPPAAARPVRLSVTQVETLVRDPYAIYARHVLRLKRLDPPGRAPDALARGTALHAVMEAFGAATDAGLPADAAALFRAIARDAIAAEVPWPATRALWFARLDRAAEWLVATESERRARAAPRAREIAGTLALATPHGFTLSAKADRIDATADDAYALYDYKSGGLPSASEARAFHLQLPLEAAIAAAGGFEGLPPGPTIHMELIGLGAGGTSRTIDADPGETRVRLIRLIALYQTTAGFTARLRPQKLSYDSDYDHLSRFGEWSDEDTPLAEDLA
jgi:double-strand break repair protein AddB